MVTIRDVAKRAGLSVMVVSRALRSEGYVSADAAAAARRAAEDLGYHRNVFARGLQSARSSFVCLIIPDTMPNYVIEFQQGAIAVCRERGYHLVVETHHNAEDATQSVARALALRPDGFILLPPVSDDLAALDLLERAAIPYVRIAPSVAVDRGGSVKIDDREAARQITHQLLDLGHRDVGFFAGDPEHAAARWRFEGFAQALHERGLEVRPHFVRQANFSFLRARACALELFIQGVYPTGIFACNDDMALGVMAAAQELGVAVPESLSVVGFDDSEPAALVWPRLTTVRQPIREIAAAALESVLAQLKNPSFAARVELPFEIVVRDTTAPPPSAALQTRAP